MVLYSKAWAKSYAAQAFMWAPIGNKHPQWVLVETAEGEVDPIQLEADLAPVARRDFLWAGKAVVISWICIAGLMLVGFCRYGQRLMRATFHRGKEIVSPKEIRRLIPRKKTGDYTLADVPLPKNSELQHTMILGAPGTGKTLTLMALLERIRKLGHKVLVYDPTGAFYSMFDRPGDFLLNPLDARSQHWNPWAEIKAPYDADSLAKSLIPIEANSDPFWANAARSILAAALNRLPKPERTVERLIEYLCTTDLSELARLVPGTDAAALLSPDNPRTALSVQATTATSNRSLRYLWAGELPLFSIRDWLARDDDSWLFLGAPADQQASLKPLLTCWLESAATAVLSMPPSQERRVFVIIDELPTLHRLEAIPRLLAQGRKYGVCGFLGLQNFAQLKDIYGPAGADALAGQCSTWLTLRVPDAESAEWTSRNLGEIDVTEVQEAINYGANSFRDGRRLSEIRKPRPVVSATQIQQLPDLEGYLRLAGPYPVVKVKVPLVKRQSIQPLYVPVDESKTVYGLLRDVPPAPHATWGKSRRKNSKF
jgi:type IV conjugative transfer system coupling protein TraD